MVGHLGRQELDELEVLSVGAVLGAEVVGVDHVVAAPRDLPLPVVVQHGGLARGGPAEQHDEGHLGALGAEVGDDLDAVLPVPAVVVAAELLAHGGDEVRGEGRGRRRVGAEGGHDRRAVVAGARRGGDEREPRQAGGQEDDEQQPGRDADAAVAECLTSRRHRTRTARAGPPSWRSACPATPCGPAPPGARGRRSWSWGGCASCGTHLTLYFAASCLHLSRYLVVGAFSELPMTAESRGSSNSTGLVAAPFLHVARLDDLLEHGRRCVLKLRLVHGVPVGQPLPDQRLLLRVREDLGTGAVLVRLLQRRLAGRGRRRQRDGGGLLRSR